MSLIDLERWSSTFSAPWTGFVEDSFSTDWGRGDGLRKIQAHYICCALYFYYDDISSTVDHQALGCRGWGPPSKEHAITRHISGRRCWFQFSVSEPSVSLCRFVLLPCSTARIIFLK